MLPCLRFLDCANFVLSAGCVSCPPGRYSPASGRDTCSYAASGKYVPSSGATAPLDCPWRLFQDQSGQSTCKDCYIPACTLDTQSLRNSHSTAAALYKAPFERPMTAFEARWGCQYPAARYNLEALSLGDLASASQTPTSSSSRIQSLLPSSQNVWIGAHQRAAFGPGSFAWVDGDGGSELLTASGSSSLFSPGAQNSFDHSKQCAYMDGSTKKLQPSSCQANKNAGLCQIRELPGSCPPGWIRSPMSNNCLRLAPQSSSWAGGPGACAALKLGSTLASFESSVEIYWAQTLFSKYNVQLMWTSAHSIAGYDVWTWSLGSNASSHSMLGANQRVWGGSGRSIEGNCAALDSQLGELRAKDCALTLQPLCSLPVFDGSASGHLSEPCPSGFVPSPVDDRCYRLLDEEPVSLQAAMTECAKHDSVVASGSSFAETMWLVEHFGGKTLFEQLAGMWVNWRRTHGDPNVFSRSWGAYSDAPVFGSISTTDTLRFPLRADGSSFSPWATGQPNNYNPYEPDDCVILAGAINGGLIGARSVDCVQHEAYPLCMWDRRIISGPSLVDSDEAARDPLVPQLPFQALCPLGFSLSASSGACLRLAQSSTRLTRDMAEQTCAALRPDAVLLPWATNAAELEQISLTQLLQVSVASAWTGARGTVTARMWPYGGNSATSALAPGAATQIWNRGTSAHSIRGPAIDTSSVGVVLARGGMALGRDPEKEADAAICALYPGCPHNSIRHPLSGLCFSVVHLPDKPEEHTNDSIETAADLCQQNHRGLVSYTYHTGSAVTEDEFLAWVQLIVTRFGRGKGVAVDLKLHGGVWQWSGSLDASTTTQNILKQINTGNFSCAVVDASGL